MKGTNMSDEIDASAVAQVSIGGWVKRPLRLSAAALNARDDSRPTAFTVVCTFDGAHGGERRMRGVALCTLIEEAEPAFEQRTDFKRVTVVAESRDGYRALFSWNELFNTSVGEGVLVAWPDGQPRGPIALLSLHDRATGPRYVQGLAAVTLHKAW
jgi:hypothetical protein